MTLYYNNEYCIDSLKIIEKGLGTNINNENLYLEKGVILLALNNFDEALKNFNIALSLNSRLSSVNIII